MRKVALQVYRYVPLAALALSLSACQTYAPEPVDLTGYGAGWRERPVLIKTPGEWLDGLGLETQDAVVGIEDGLSLKEGTLLLLEYNPALRVARAEASIAAERAEHAGRWDDPALDLLTGNKEADGADDVLVLGAGMGITLPLSGRPAIERALAQANQDAADALTRREAWSAAQELQVEWAAWSVASEKQRVLEESIAALEDLTRRAEVLMDAGELPATEARLLKLALLQDQHTLRGVAREAERLRLHIFAMLGVHPETELALQPCLGGGGAPPVDTDVSTLARLHPEVVRMQAEYGAAERALQLQIRKQYPDLRISPAVQDEENESVISVGLGLPLAAWNRNQEAIAAAEAARTAARERLHAAYESAVFGIEQARLDFESAQAIRAAVENEQAPLADEQLRAMQALLDVGEANILLLHQSIKDALQTKLAWLDARFAEARAAVTLRAFAQLHEYSANESNEGN